MPALWMNAASLGLLASIWWTYRLYATAVVPSLALSLGAIGAELPLPVRLHLAFMGPLVQWGVPALAGAVSDKELEVRLNAVIKLGPGHRYRFDYDRCTGCAVCYEQCPVHAIEMVAED